MPSEKSGGLLEGEVTTTWGHSERWDRRHPRLRQLDPPLTAAFRAVLQYRSADSESLSILERLGVVVPANGGKWQVCTHHPSPALLNDMLPHLSSLAAIDADAMARLPQWHQLRAMATYCAIAATAHSHSMRDQLPEAFIHRYVGELAAGAFLSFKQLVGVSNSTGGKLANLAADGYVADAVIVDAAVCRMDCVEATAPSIETVLQRCRLFSKRGDGMATQLPHVAKFLKAVGLTTSDDLRAPFVFAWTCVPEANKTWPPTLSVPLPHGMASLDPAAWTPPVDGSSSTTAGSNDVGGGSAVNRDSSTEAAVVERPTRFCGIAVDSSLDINASDRSAFVEKGETWTVTSDSAAMPAEPRAAPRIPDGTGPLKVATDVNTKKDRDATRLHRLENDHAVRYRNAAHSTKPGGCGPDKPRDSEHSPGAPKICTTTAPPTATTVAAGCGPGEDLTVSLQFPFNRATPVAFNFRGMEVTRGPRSTPLSESETSQAWASAACDGRHPQLRILTEAQKAAIRCLYAGGALTPSGAKRKPVLLGLVELGVVACETATPEMSDFTVSPNVTAHMLPHVMPSAKTVDAVASPQYQRIRALALYASIVVAAARSLTTEQRSDKPRTHMIKYVEQYVADEEMAKRFVNEALDGPCAVAREEGSLKWMEVTFRGAPLKTPAARLVPDGFVADGIVMDAACELAAHSRPSVNSHVIDSQLTSSLLLTELPQGARDHVIRFLHAVGLLASDSPSAPFASQWELLPLAEQKWPPHWPLPFPHLAVADPAAWASRAPPDTTPASPMPTTAGAVASRVQDAPVDARRRAVTLRLFDYAKLCSAHVTAPMSLAISKQRAHIADLIKADLKANISPEIPDTSLDAHILAAALEGVLDGLPPAAVHRQVIAAKEKAGAGETVVPAPAVLERVQASAPTLAAPEPPSAKRTRPEQQRSAEAPTVQQASTSAPQEARATPTGLPKTKAVPQQRPPPTSDFDRKLDALRTARGRSRGTKSGVRGVCAAFAAFTPTDAESMTDDQARSVLGQIVDSEGFVDSKFTEDAPATLRVLLEKAGFRAAQAEIDQLFRSHVATFHDEHGNTPKTDLLDDFYWWWRDNKVPQFPDVSETALKKAWKALAANPPSGLCVINVEGELMVVRADAPRVTVAPPPEATTSSPSKVSTAPPSKATPPPKATAAPAEQPTSPTVEYDSTTPPEELLLVTVTTMSGGVGNVIGKKSDAIKRAQRRFPFLTETALKKAWKVLVDDGCVKVTDGTAALHRAELLGPPVPLAAAAAQWVSTKDEEARTALLKTEADSREGIECYRTYKLLGSGLSTAPYADVKHLLQRIAAVRHALAQLSFPGEAYVSTMVLTLEARLKTVPSQAHVNMLFSEFARDVNAPSSLRSKSEDTQKQWYFEIFTQRRWVLLHPVHRLEQIRLDAAWQHVKAQTKSPEPAVAPVTPKPKQAEPADAVAAAIQDLSYHSLREMYLEEEDVINIVLVVVGCWSELVTASQPCRKEVAISRITTQGPVHPLMKKQPQRCRDALERCFGMNLCYDKPNADTTLLRLTAAGAARLYRVKAAWVAKTEPTPSPPPPAPTTPQSARLSPMPVSPAPNSPLVLPTPVPAQVPVRVGPTPSVLSPAPAVVVPQAAEEMTYHSLREMYLEEQDVVIIALIVVGCWSELVTASQPCTKGNAISRATMQGPVHPLLKKDSQRCRDALERCVALKYCDETKNADGHGVLSLSRTGVSRLAAVKTKWVGKTVPTPVSTAPPQAPVTPVPAQTPSPPVAVARVAPLPQVSVRVGTDSAPANLSHAALTKMYMEEGDEVIIALIVVGCWSELVTASQPCTKGNAISRVTMQGPVHPLMKKQTQRCRGALERCVALKYCVEKKNADGHGVLSLSSAGASRLSAVKAKWAAEMKETSPVSSSPAPPALTPSPVPIVAVASAPPAATPQGSATKPAAPPPKRVLKKTPVAQLPTSPSPGAVLTPPPAAPAAVVPPQRTVPGRSVLHPGAPQALDNTLLSAFMGPSTVAPHQPRDDPPSMTMQSARAAPEHSFDPFDLYSAPSPSSAAHTAAAPALAKKKQQAPPTPPLAQAPYEQTTPAPAIASTAADAFFEQPAATAPRRTIAQDKVEAAMNAFFQ